MKKSELKEGSKMSIVADGTIGGTIGGTLGNGGTIISPADFARELVADPDPDKSKSK
jgi:hypothetical protein